MKLPFGIYKDTFIHISEVNSGKTKVLCPYCNQSLIAKKGRIKRHHFAHDGTGCTQHFSNNFFGILGKLPTRLPLSVYALKKKAKINTYFVELKEAQNLFLNKSGQKNLLVPVLMTELKQLAKEDKTGDIKEIIEQIRRFLQQKIAPFPEFHLIRNKVFKEFTDGKTGISFTEIDTDRHEYFYPQEFHKYVQFLKNYHSSEYEFSEVTSKLTLFKKDLVYFKKFDLYFLEINADGKLLYKIGLTSRPLEARLKEIEVDLKNFYLSIKIKPLFMKNGVAFIETFFKQKYTDHQFKIGQLTEYFTFPKPILTLILKDLNLLNFDKIPDRTNAGWLDWQFLRYNGKLYGYEEKSIYIENERIKLTKEEAKKLEEWNQLKIK